MPHRNTALWMLLSLLSFTNVTAQDLSNKGRDFWIAYAGHIDGTNSRMALYLTSDQNAAGTVEVNGTSVSFTVAANQITTVQLTNASLLNNALAYNGQVEGIGIKKGIHITADRPVAVYAHILNAARSGSTLALPTHVLGKEYYVSSYKSSTPGTTRRSQFNVVATMDNTTVQITPSQGDAAGVHQANVPFTVLLGKGDVYQYQSDEDLTGTHIQSIGTTGGSCQPVAVFSGSTFASMGCASAGTGDNLYQQLFPFSAWGKTYYTAPFIARAYDIFRILVQDPQAPVYVNGNALNPASLVSGRFYEINTMGNNTSLIITSAKPICVLQYMITQGCDGVNSDPEMIILNPIEQTLNDITVMSARRDLTPPNTNITSHYLNIIFKADAFNSLKIDGSTPTATPIPIPGTDYSYIQQDVTAATAANPSHRILSDSGFICIAYGYGNVESYGYNAGSNVKDLYQFISIQNQFATVDFPSTCTNTPFYLSMTFPYQPTRVEWKLAAIGQQDVTLNAPVFDSSYMVNGKTLYRYKLPDPFTTAKTGSYLIKVQALNPMPDGCSGEQEISYDLIVYDPPVPAMKLVSNECFNTPVQFSDMSAGNNRPVVQWIWQFGDGTTSAQKNPGHLYAVPGGYTASLAVITDIGCISDTTQQLIQLHTPPVATLEPAAPFCMNKKVTFQHSVTTQSAITKWKWDFGDGTAPVVGTNDTPPIHIFSKAGSYAVTLQVETAAGCQSAVAIKNISVTENPVAAFSFGNACLPDGRLQFMNQSSFAGSDNTALSFRWTFGDGAVSAESDPVHRYSATGPFAASLVALSAAGCTDTAKKEINTVFAQPVARFTVNNNKACQDRAFVFAEDSNAANAAVTEWVWNFGDGTTSAEKNPSKVYALPGNYEVTMFTRSGVGCVSDTARENIIVHALPVSRFAITSLSCATKAIVFADRSVAQEGKLTAWKWNMGTGAQDTMRNSSASFPFVYTTPGSYRVSLETQNDKGCTARFDSLITVHPQPVAGFGMSANCLVDPYSEFTDSSFISGGMLTDWSWNFGDPNAGPGNPNVSGAPKPRHKYAEAITYQVSLVVTSDKGCQDNITQPFTINGSLPQARVAVAGGNEICSNDSVRIINHSFADVGNIVKLEIYWDYLNDPSSRQTILKPVVGKSYGFKYPSFFTPAATVYAIRIVAYSGDNCMKDSTITISLKNIPQLTMDAFPAVCGNAPPFRFQHAAVLNAAGGKGIYSGPGTAADGLFNPAAAGTGLHNIRYQHTADNGCSHFKDGTIEIYPAPSVQAGPDIVMLEGGSGQLKASGNGRNISYLWSPAQWLSSPSVADPKTTAANDIIYSVTVTSSDGCKASDDVAVKVLKMPSIPNVFSPNGDGINDRWVIKHLETYPSATVSIFNRYGQLIFYSKGYSQPWDGTFNGRPVAAGTYYYVLHPGSGRKQIAGFVDLIR